MILVCTPKAVLESITNVGGLASLKYYTPKNNYLFVHLKSSKQILKPPPKFGIFNPPPPKKIRNLPP